MSIEEKIAMSLLQRVKIMVKKPMGVLTIIAALLGGGSIDTDIRSALINLSNTVVKKFIIEVPTDTKMVSPAKTVQSNPEK